MKSELDKDFIILFNNLQERVKITARKNYKLWKENPRHPSLEFKRLKTNEIIYSVHVGKKREDFETGRISREKSVSRNE